VHPVQAVILAAGFSSRAGTFKPLMELRGKTLIQRCIEAFSGLCSELIVVGGYEAERLGAALASFPGVRMVVNQDYERGMFSSVKRGVSEIRTERFFLTPADYPLIDPGTCRALLDVQGPVVVPSYGGRNGHPVLLDGSLIPEILAEDDDSSLRALLSRKTKTVVPVDDQGILRDLDTPEDLEALDAIYGRNKFVTQ